ncbi:hypothetical protein ABI59_21835 [Acidobacteria bacterium Mor1]|nr:hypothetical protein ABI59_21835 [Acidobacteria bacterium Mor1]
MQPYPVFLIDLADRRCVVIGGDHEAERKTRELLEVGARPLLIAAEVTSGLAALARADRIEHLSRDYRDGDLRGAFLVIASGQPGACNHAIRNEARGEGTICNVMDVPGLCDFVAGSVVRRGPLTVAISTAGCGPALAVRLREQLQELLTPAHGRLLELMAGLRDRVKARHPVFSERKRRWFALVDSDVLDKLAAGREPEALRQMERILDLPSKALRSGGPAPL